MLDTELHSRDNRYDLDSDFSTVYYGLGANIGYQWDIFGNRDMIDIYTRYIWTHLNKDKENIDSQDYHFHAINSHQARVGAQYNFKHNSEFSPFIGAAVQYEFDGEAGASIRGHIDTERPDITGTTGLLEVGIRMLPSEEVPFTTSMNFEAYVGKRRGVSATLDLAYSF